MIIALYKEQECIANANASFIVSIIYAVSSKIYMVSTTSKDNKDNMIMLSYCDLVLLFTYSS